MSNQENPTTNYKLQDEDSIEDPISNRQSLIDDYKKQTLNKGDINYYDVDIANAELISVQKKKEQKKKRRLIIILAAVVLLLVTILILAVTLKDDGNGGNDEPDQPIIPDPPIPPVPPTPPSPPVYTTVNPYSLSSTPPVTSYDGVEYSFTSNTSGLQYVGSVPTTDSNQYYNNLAMRSSAMSYSTMRMQIFNESLTPSNDASSNDWISQTYLSQNYRRDQQNGLKYEIPFTVENYTHENGTSFFFNLQDQTKQTNLLNTMDQNFIMMTTYLEMGFKVFSKNIFGIGERISNFVLTEGNYTVFPYFGPYVYDNGDGGLEQYGQHPFVLVQTSNSQYFGIFLFNTNAQTIQIVYNDDDTTSINFIATGGILDIFFLLGPSYDNVIQQYQQIIGFPKLLPYWANGFFTKSLAYTNETLLEDALTLYELSNMTLDGWALPINAMKNLDNFNFSVTIGTIRKRFPQLSYILPYTYIVTDVNEQTTLLSEGEMVSIYNTTDQGGISLAPLYIDVNGSQGLCMDVFNPTFLDTYLKPQFNSVNPQYNGYWLDSNTPFVSSIVSQTTDNIQTNPYYDAPYAPGQANKGSLSQGTLPENALHYLGSGNLDYHYNLHSMYGSQMAIAVQQALQSSSYLNKYLGFQAFVISDSTFPGAGQYGIGHVLPQNVGSWSDLQYSVANILNFNMFGIPNIGTNLAGFYTTTDLELYVRYFQLAVISPIGLFNDGNDTTLENHPFAIGQEYSVAIKSLLQDRLAMFNYMRTELYRISKKGGALIKPLFAEYPTDTNIDVSSVSQLMFGSSVMVCLALQQGQSSGQFYFPVNGKSSSLWLDLETFEVSNTTATQGLKTIDLPLAQVQRFQTQGSILAVQENVHNRFDNITSISQLDSIPLIISVFLDEDQQAEGHILLENSNEASDLNEYYFIKAQGNIISFKQQNNGSTPHYTNKNIGTLIITGTKDIIGSAQGCVLYNDYQTVKPLLFNVSRITDGVQQQIFKIQLPWEETEENSLSISDIAFLFYGQISNGFNDGVCNASLFNWNMTASNTPDDYNFVATVQQNIYNMIPGTALEQTITVNISMLSDDIVYIDFNSTTGKDQKVLDKTFSSFQGISKTYKLAEIMTINADPFYIELHSPNKPGKVIFTTQNQIQFVSNQVSILNLEYPNSDPNRFYGLGERKGPFFLRGNSRYSLYSNNNNLTDQIQSGGRLVNYGKSGFFPIVYSQNVTGTQTTGILSFQTGGGDYLFFNDTSTDAGPRTTYVSSLSHDFLAITETNPLDAAQALQSLITLGSMDETRKQIILPPPDWMFGSYVLLENRVTSKEDLQNIINMYETQLQWPIEGIVLGYKNLDQYQSMTFNSSQFPNPQQTVAELEANNMTIVQILQPGLSLDDKSTIAQNIQSAKAYVKTPDGSEPVIGQDLQGTVYYVDFSNQEPAEQFVGDVIANYKSTYGATRTPVQLLKNEITDQYCNGNCVYQSMEEESVGLFFRPGCNDLMDNLLVYNQVRDFGTEEEIHNINGLLQQFVFANRFNTTRNQVPLISSSTTIGSGEIGNVGRSMDYFEFTDYDAISAFQSLQSLSLFGVPISGYQLDMDDVPAGYRDTSNQTFNMHMKVLAFSPLSFSNLRPLSSSSSSSGSTVGSTFVYELS